MGVQLNKTKREQVMRFCICVYEKKQNWTFGKTDLPDNQKHAPPNVCVCVCALMCMCACICVELTAQGSRRSWSATSGQEGLTFQEFPNSSAVDSTMPCRVVKSFSVSPSKFPHSPPTRPRRWAATRTYTRIPADIMSNEKYITTDL